MWQIFEYCIEAGVFQKQGPPRGTKTGASCMHLAKLCITKGCPKQAQNLQAERNSAKRIELVKPKP